MKAHPVFGNSSLMYRHGALKLLIENAPSQLIDFYVYIHLASQGKIGAINQVLGMYTVGVGISSSINLYELAIQALAYGEKFDLSKDVVHFAGARQYLLFAKKALVENNIELFIELISLSRGLKHISLQQGFLYVFRKAKILLKLISLAVATRSNLRKIIANIR